MVTARPRLVTQGDQVASNARRCAYCPELIVWMRTFLGGRSYCFDARPVPTDLDDGTGWVPGDFPVNGSMTTVLAPLHEHPPHKRQRVQQVMQLHHCAGRRRVA